jgi:hypothetical protein
MLKKKMILGSILFVSVLTFSNPTWAASCSDVFMYDYDQGGYYYAIDGSLKISANFPNYVTASISLPRLSNFGDFEGFYFGSDGYLWDDLLYNYTELPIGYWEQDGCTIYIDFGDLVGTIQTMFEGSGIAVEPVGSTTATAKIASDGSNSGKLSLKFNIYSDIVDGGISISLSFKGYPYELSGAYPLNKKASVKKDKASLNLEIKNFLSSVLSKLPRKGSSGLGPRLLKSH